MSSSLISKLSSRASEGPLCAWHLSFGGTTNYGHGVAIEPGRTIEIDGPLVEGKNGLHGGVSLLSCLWALPFGTILNNPAYADGCWPALTLGRCRFDGPIVWTDRVDVLQLSWDIFVTSRRTPLWLVDLDGTLDGLALDLAATVVDRERAEGHEPDPECLDAYNAKLAFRRGEIDRATLIDAWVSSIGALNEIEHPARRAAALALSSSAWWWPAISAGNVGGAFVEWSVQRALPGLNPLDVGRTTDMATETVERAFLARVLALPRLVAPDAATFEGDPLSGAEIASPSAVRAG